MADVRALLKARREEARITHPYATYNHSGQLKCSVCGSLVKHASAWEGHLGSKIHRTNIIRLREQEKQQQNSEDSVEPARKRKAIEEPTEILDEKKRRVQSPGQGFPQDFFSDPSRAPVPLSDSEEEEEGEGDKPIAKKEDPPLSVTEVDAEYERFQRELATNPDPSDAYDRATIAAEPVPASAEISGFPPTTEDGVAPGPVQLTDEEAAKKRDQEERELIMDRLLAEERAQEDADTRVQLLKNKLDELRRKREAAKANKRKVA